MKDSNFYQVQGWMINQLGLKGNELICYAVIFCFCQDEESIYMGGLNYLKGWMNASEPTVLKALTGLVEKGLLEKQVVITETGKKCFYKVTKESLVGETKETLVGVTKESLVHNINIIELNNNRNNKSVSNDTPKVDSLFETFWEKYGYKKSKKPTISAWRKLTKEQKEAAIKGIEIYKEDCRRNQRQMKHPSTYLNQLTWEDDFTTDGMVNEQENELPSGLSAEFWESCKVWFIKNTPRICGYITPEVYMSMKSQAKDGKQMTDIIRCIEDSGYSGDIAKKFTQLLETGEYKEGL